MRPVKALPLLFSFSLDVSPAETSLFLSPEVIGEGGGGSCWLGCSRDRLDGVEMLSELVQGSTVETPSVLNKDKLQASGCPPTYLGTGCTNDSHRNS